MDRNWKNEAAALWLAPFVATLPLIPFMSIPSSPFFLGKLMGESGHPFNWPQIGPLISAAAVFFDAEILGLVAVAILVAPIYAGLRRHGLSSVRNTLILCAGAGLVVSQLAHVIAQGFPQAGMRAFASSWASALLGCLCGLAAGCFIAYFSNRRLARVAICSVPVAAMGIAAALMMWSGSVYRGH